ncbi:MAG TPA: hypothetical protein ENF89_00790 [Candidatus Bathyarchaeota archaeon]|nr:hypothetical protein [Candidatus Bathyarchaeota archaeon]
MVHRASVKSSPWHLCIGGFKLKTPRDVESLLREVTRAASPHLAQLFDADRVAGWEHLYLATVNAVRAFQSGYNIARSLSMEVLLYVSCRDQIAEAIRLVGVSPETERAALLVLAEDEGECLKAYGSVSRLLGEEDDSLLEVDEAKLRRLMELHEISEEEVEAVGGQRAEAITLLLVERGALIPAMR